MTVKQISLETKFIQDILDGGVFYAKEMAKEMCQAVAVLRLDGIQHFFPCVAEWDSEGEIRGCIPEAVIGTLPYVYAIFVLTDVYKRFACTKRVGRVVSYDLRKKLGSSVIKYRNIALIGCLSF